MNEDWIALFDNDFTVRVFQKPAACKDIKYWIKRFHNGKFHRPSSTFNSYALRGFEIFDSNLANATISDNLNGNWKCVSFTEAGLDAHGSYCYCVIKDRYEKTENINIHGQWQFYGGFQTTIQQHLYFSAILFFLKLLSQYDGWTDVKENNKKLINGIPFEIFEKVEKRDAYLKDLNADVG